MYAGPALFRPLPGMRRCSSIKIDILCMTWPYLQCLYPPWPQQVAPRHIFHLAIPGWAVSRSSKSFFWPRAGSPHGSRKRYNHCVCSTRFSSRRKAPGFCQGIYHPIRAELFWQPDVELGLRLWNLHCDQLSQAWRPGGPLGVIFHPVLGLVLLHQARVTDWEHQHYHVYIPLGTQVDSRRL